MIFHSSAPLHCHSTLHSLNKNACFLYKHNFFLPLSSGLKIVQCIGTVLVFQSKGTQYKPRNFTRIHIFNDFPQISTLKDFKFQLFWVLRGSTLRFDGSPLLFLTFYSNQSGRGVSVEQALVCNQACRLLCHLIVTSAFFKLRINFAHFYFGIFQLEYF